MKRLTGWGFLLAVLILVNGCIEAEAAIVIVTTSAKAQPAELARAQKVTAGTVALGTDPTGAARLAAVTDLVKAECLPPDCEPAQGTTIFITLEDTATPADVCQEPDSDETAVWKRSFCGAAQKAIGGHVTGNGLWFRFQCSGTGKRERFGVDVVVECPTPAP